MVFLSLQILVEIRKRTRYSECMLRILSGEIKRARLDKG